jgi:hypothetical protein
LTDNGQYENHTSRVLNASLTGRYVVYQDETGVSLMDMNGNDKLQNRGQAWTVDEQNLTATLTYSADLGAYTICCGSMQALKGGGYHSVAGGVDPATVHGRVVEVDKHGKTVFAIELDGVIVYRSFRTEDMYSATVK